MTMVDFGKIGLNRGDTHTVSGPFSGTTHVSRYQKGKTNLDFTEARDSEWQWHQVGQMQVCTSLQTDNHASTPPFSFFTGQMPFLSPNQQCQSTEGINIKSISTYKKQIQLCNMQLNYSLNSLMKDALEIIIPPDNTDSFNNRQYDEMLSFCYNNKLLRVQIPAKAKFTPTCVRNSLLSELRMYYLFICVK